jgi:acyl-CoA reductase-like NAD-dependent aldehyde dehydrogenase
LAQPQKSDPSRSTFMTSTVAAKSGNEDPQSPTELRSTNPSTGELVATFPVHSDADVAAAVARAEKAAPTWAGLGFADRETALLRWAAKLVERTDEFTALIHRENGKPTEDAYAELMLALEHIHWAARNAKRVLRIEKVSPGMLMSNFAASIEQRPYGVIGVIGPWNYPVYTPTGSLAYALAAGNTVVFKPSEHTPAVGKFMIDAFVEANPQLPDGVAVLITGYGATGAALCRARGVGKLAFTGSAATGRKIMSTCSENLTPVLIEAGGKDPMIVAEDADLAAAARAAAFGGISNSGQTCIGIERVYVVESVRDQFIAELRKQLDGIKPGMAEDAAYGPMTMPNGAETVRRHIDEALAGGGKAVIGGPESVREPFIDPVVILDAPEDSSAVREETFGPTLTVRTVADVDEAVELANDTTFGLASSVYSKSRGLEIARRVNAGATSVNSVLAFAAISSLPFGGRGESGFGRIHGAYGLREFSMPKSIARQKFAVPGMDLFTFRRNKAAMALVRKVVAIRYGRPH